MSFRTNPGSQWSEAPGSGVAASVTAGYLAEVSPSVYTAAPDRSTATHEINVTGGVATVVPIGTAASPLRIRRRANTYFVG